MFLRGCLLAAGLFLCLCLGPAGAALAQVRIEAPRVEIPDRRPDPSTGVNMGELVGGLFALRDGYDRTRRGYICALTYDDRNGNGQRDRGEGPLPGWRFTIADAAGATVAQGVADDKGRFCNDRPLAPGAYSVRQGPGADWINTEPGRASPDVKPVALPVERSVTVLFGNCQGARCGTAVAAAATAAPAHVAPVGPGTSAQSIDGTLCVLKYSDLNANGQMDAGEPTMSFWVFSIYDPAAGIFVMNGTTDASAPVCAPVPASSYTVYENNFPGWVNTAPGSNPVIVISGQTTTVEIGNHLTVPNTQVCIEKYHDLDVDGQRDPGEPPLAGWAFQVFSTPNTGWGAMVSTDVNGQACLGLAPGTYGAREILVWYSAQNGLNGGGWANSDPTQSSGPNPEKTFTLTAGQIITVQFGNYQPYAPGQICVTKYNDLNGNGARDAGEPGVPGMVFGFSDSSGNSVYAGQTNAQGRLCAPLVRGTYTVSELPNPAWVSTDPGGLQPQKSATIVVPTPYAVVELVFGNRSTSQACAFKYNDLNGNGTMDPGEPPLPNWNFSAQLPGGLVSPGVTDANGKACWPHGPGTYKITETLSAGWMNTEPGGQLSQTVVVPAGQTIEARFGNVGPGMACIIKYDDQDGDGQRDPGEPTLNGWHMTVTTPAGALVGQDDTSGAGQTCFELRPGTYVAVETPQAGWTNTDPSGGAPQKGFTVVTGQTVNVLFGNQGAPVLTVEKFADTACTGQSPFTNCAFHVRIRNIGPVAYSGPASFSDNVLSGSTPIAGVTLATPPPGWNCSGVQPVTCTNPSVSIPAGGYIDVAFAFAVNVTPPPDLNCVNLLTPTTAGPACVRIGAVAYDLSVDTSIGRLNPPGSPLREYLILVNSNMPLPPGTVLTVTGSLTPTGYFSPMAVLTPGWQCSGSWASFQCTLTTTSGAAQEQLMLQTTSTAAGQTITYTAAVTAANNADPNPGNNSRTETGPLN